MLESTYLSGVAQQHQQRRVPSKPNLKYPPHQSHTIPLGAQADMCRQALKRATSGAALPPRFEDPAGERGAAGNAGSAAGLGGEPRRMRCSASMKVLSPYTQHAVLSTQPTHSHSKRLLGGGSFHPLPRNADVGTLEARLLDAMQTEEGSGKRRLGLFRAIFDRVIESEDVKASPYGAMLRRIKLEYEAALQANAPSGGVTLQQATKEVRRLQRENEQLRQELEGASLREQALGAQMHALEMHMYNMECEDSAAQAEEDEAALAAELAEEMPASARPGNITPTLGSGRLAIVKSPPPKPSCIPVLNMRVVEATRCAPRPRPFRCPHVSRVSHRAQADGRRGRRRRADGRGGRRRRDAGAALRMITPTESRASRRSGGAAACIGKFFAGCLDLRGACCDEQDAECCTDVLRNAMRTLLGV